MPKLQIKYTSQITPTSPFNFDETVYKPAHFPSNDMKYEPGKRWQTMLWRGEGLGLVIENRGTVEKPKVLLHIYSQKKLIPEVIQNITDEISWRFNFHLDLNDFYGDMKNDSILKPVIKRRYGMRPMHHGSLYEYLVISILLQNATVRRSVSMMQTLFEKYGTLLTYNNHRLWCFWKPEILAHAPEEELRALKVGYRAKSLLKISQAFAHKEVDELTLRRQSKEDQEKELLKLYGVGPASVHILMFEVFNRMDYQSHIPPWEQKIYTKLFFNKDYEKNLVSEKEMLKYFERWGKWKKLAVNYVWEDLWWRHKQKSILWLEKLIRL